MLQINKKVTKYILFRKECNELLVIRYLILSVTVPLQLLVPAIRNVTKLLLVITKSNQLRNLVTD
jgi:hypothetical protein